MAACSCAANVKMCSLPAGAVSGNWQRKLADGKIWIGIVVAMVYEECVSIEVERWVLLEDVSRE